MSTATEDPTGIDIPKSSLYLSQHQVEDYKDDINAIETSLRDPRARLDDRPAVVRQLHNIKRDLETQEPPDTTGEQRDAVAREEGELRSKISGSLLSAEEMRKCPPGAIGHELALKALKPDILRWKNLRRIQNKGNADPDISNVELLRPRTNRLNMDNALIPGKNYHLSPNTQQYKDHYDRTFKQGDHAEDAEPSPSDVKALLAKIAKLEGALGPQDADTKEQQTGETMQFTATAKCGKTFKGGADFRVKNGKRAHERACKKCKEIAE